MTTTHEAWFQTFRERAKGLHRHIVLPEGVDDRTILAAAKILAEGICAITVLGEPAKLTARAAELGVSLEGATLRNPATDPDSKVFADAFFEARKAKGMTEEKAAETMRSPLYFGGMMVKTGQADGFVAGALKNTGDNVRGLLPAIGCS